jgi:hypothetical protein
MNAAFSLGWSRVRMMDSPVEHFNSHIIKLVIVGTEVSCFAARKP